MKKQIMTDCQSIMEALYEDEKDHNLPLLAQIRIRLHLVLCPRCSQELKTLEQVKELMTSGFFPPCPDFSEPLMARILEEEALETEEPIYAKPGFSFKLWIIIGFFVLLSLPSSYFGMNYVGLGREEGPSFLLPLGLTIGMVLTCYGAFFIGSHLKQLSDRFRLR
ncbi:MAG: peptidoglycan-binding protein [Treponema sp.]|nr:peptidoglycan-binding protein [Treponema sp.]